jgi:sphingomyelin phosphodiesterase acid-like 3
MQFNFRHWGIPILCVLLPILFSEELWGQKHPTRPPKSETQIRALLLSDPHVNVFYDPQKVNALLNAPASHWAEILARPDSPTRVQNFEKLHIECQAGGDPSPAIFAATMRSIASNASDVRFITISGDFLPHKIDCVLAKLIPGISPQQYADFTARIIEYEVSQIRQALPKARLYLALGNNDSNCRDNYLDTDTDWLKTLASVAKDGVGDVWDKRATESFEQGGYYSVPMATPMQKTRLIVANDVLLTGGFRGCSGKTNPEAAEKQLTWLRSELKKARDQHEQVWLMTHIQPGMSTILRPNMENMCKPDSKLASGQKMLSDALSEYADITRLALFGHSHQDQFQLLEGSTGTIPAKVVRAVPSYTLARVNPQRAEMVDYLLMQPQDVTKESWVKEYAFSNEYGVNGYTARNLQDLIAGFDADGEGTSPASQHYLLHFAGGNPEQARKLQQTWPITACQMDHINPEKYKQCVCQSRLGTSLGSTTP